MSEDRPVGTIAVVNDGRLSRGTTAALAHRLQKMVEDGTIPRLEVIQEDTVLKQNAALAAVLASSPPSFLDMHREAPKRPKEKTPEEVQAQRIAAAEAKRERRKQRRLAKGT